ncbi:MAG: peptide deformylase [Tatlockia sp.]|nr:peptide deformylase [Tatlockia sp.]
MIEPQAHALEIINTDHPAQAKLLQTASQPIKFPLCKDDLDLIEAMKRKLTELGGVGLAAPQVNHPKQIIAIYIPEESALLRNNAKAYPMHILINPAYEMIETAETSLDFEACYSVSNKAGMVPRFNKIKVHFYDEQGQLHSAIETGFYARVLQHEIDHINGTLIVDRLTPDCVQGTMEEMMSLRRKALSEDKRILFDRLMEEKLNKASTNSFKK